MTRHGLLDKHQLTKLNWHVQLIFSEKKKPNLVYAVVKLNFACMHLAGWGHMFSLSAYHYLYGCHQAIIYSKSGQHKMIFTKSIERP